MRKNGFTLLELAIVLVIIGLVVGGVLVGTDLIKSAKLQKVLREVQSYQNAVATFQLKYSALPGDMPDPERYFPGLVWNSGEAGHGDGIILGGPEGADAWRQMSLAGLIGAGGMQGAEYCGFSPSSPGSNCPQRRDITAPGSAYSDRTGWYIGISYIRDSKNSFLFSGSGGYAKAWGARSNALTSLGASNIDAKIDDGMPSTGSVRNEDTAGGMSTADTDDRNQWRCYYSDVTPQTYVMVDGLPACSLSFPLGL